MPVRSFVFRLAGSDSGLSVLDGAVGIAVQVKALLILVHGAKAHAHA